MGFSTLQWIESGFSKSYLEDNISSVDDAQSVVDQILADSDLVAQGGSVAPVDWAKQVSWILGGAGANNFTSWDSFDDIYDQDRSGTEVSLGDEIFGWLSGEQQNHKKSRYLSKWEDAKQNIKEKVESYKVNVASVLADGKNTPEQLAEVERLKEEYADYISMAEKLGMDVPDPVKTASGDYLTASEYDDSSTGSTSTTGGLGKGRLGEPVDIKEQTDGTWSIIGKESGNEYVTGFTNSADANAIATALQSGSAPDLTTGGSSILPEDIDLDGLSPEQIENLEALYTHAQTDTSLLSDSSITSSTVTEETTADYFKSLAESEVAPYYAQVFKRAGEEFTRGLEYKAEARKAELEAEALQAEVASEQLATGFADTNTARSGVRKLAEARLNQQLEGIATSSRREFEYGTETLGRQAEDYLGSEYVSSLELPELAGTDIFTPAGDVKGSLEAEQTTAVETRTSELEKNSALTDLLEDPEAQIAVSDLISLYS